MTGRAAGFCTGSTVPGYINRPGGFGGQGRGGGWGGGGGWGRRNMWRATGLTGWQRAGAYGGAAYPQQFRSRRRTGNLNFRRSRTRPLP